MKKITDNNVIKAVQVFNDGGIVIFPTDTAFGIGCRIDKYRAVDRLFRIKERSLFQATPVLVDSESMALPYLLSPSDVVRRLMKTYWPGGLTIIAACNIDKIYSPIRGNTNTIGVRMPNHEATRSMIKSVGVPVIGSSANFHGKETPFTTADIDKELIRLVDFVVEGVCFTKQVSTVVDCTTKPYTIIRQGAVIVS